MLDHSILLFIVTSVLIILSPGQDMVLSRSLYLGPTTGMIIAVGVGIGFLGHTALAQPHQRWLVGRNGLTSCG